MAAPLCRADCHMRGRHLPDCADTETCRGCQPRQAGDGLWLCDLHAERLIEDAREAPELYEALTAALVRPGTEGERTTGSSAGAPVPDDEVMDAREEIRRVLLRLARLVVIQRNVSAPLITSGERTYIDTRPAALGAFVARHGLWLAAHQQAGEHADALHTAVRGRVQALAYPTTTDRLYVGRCPLLVRDIDGNESICDTRLYQYPNQPLLDCEGCGTQETIEQWQRWLVGEVGAVTDAYAVATYLASRWMRGDVSPITIRSWAHRGHITPVTRPDPIPSDMDRQVVVRDDRNRTLYRVAEVFAYAERIWGPPIRAR